MSKKAILTAILDAKGQFVDINWNLKSTVSSISSMA